jgi:hypothetical protein
VGKEATEMFKHLPAIVMATAKWVQMEKNKCSSDGKNSKILRDKKVLNVSSKKEVECQDDLNVSI